MEKIVALLGFVVLFSCSQRNNKNGNQLTTEDANPAYQAAVIKTDEITLQTFEQLPMEMQGCTVLFVSDTNYALPQYVFASNQKDMAFIRLNNKLTELKLVRRSSGEQESTTELYKAEGLELEINTRKNADAGEESWNKRGVLIIRKNGQQEKVQVTGRMGC